jgi:hypothetical protein
LDEESNAKEIQRVRNLWLAIVAVAGCALAASAQNKDTFTPMALDSGFGAWTSPRRHVRRKQIIKQFAAKESEFQQALNHYTYRRVPACRPSTTTTR